MFKAFVLYIFRNESCCAIFKFRTDIFVLICLLNLRVREKVSFKRHAQCFESASLKKNFKSSRAMYNMLSHQDNAAPPPSQLSGFSISNRGGRWTRTKEFIDTRLKYIERSRPFGVVAQIYSKQTMYEKPKFKSLKLPNKQ